MSEYHDFDAKQLGYFVGVVVAAALVVTAVYCGFFGLKKWTTTVQQGANLMMAAAPAPYQAPYQAQPVARTGSAGQYICPTHGAVGLPVLDAAGVPRCPLCKQPMSLNGPQTRAQANPVGLAAFGGGGG